MLDVFSPVSKNLNIESTGENLEILIASVGQTAEQTPHSTQLISDIEIKPFFNFEIASVGQAEMQFSQLENFESEAVQKCDSISIFAINLLI